MGDSHLGMTPAADLAVSSSGPPAGATSSSAPFSVHHVDILAHVPFKLSFDGDNYAEWKSSMLSALAQFGATDHVEEHGEDDVDEEWMRVDARVVLWIYTTISDELLDEVMTAHSTAHEVWAQLRYFFDYEEDEYVFDAGEEFRNAAQGDMSVDDYCWRLKALADALAELGEPVDDRVLTLQMVRGLNPRFQLIGAKLLAHASFPSFIQAFAWVRMEEYNLKHDQGAQ